MRLGQSVSIYASQLSHKSFPETNDENLVNPDKNWNPLQPLPPHWHFVTELQWEPHLPPNTGLHTAAHNGESAVITVHVLQA